MASSTVPCVICGQSNAKIVLFTPQTLEKRKEVLKTRKSKNLKYKEVTLPSELNSTTGYHSTCYQNFTDVMAKYKDKPKSPDPVEDSPPSSPSSSTETSGNSSNESEDENSEHLRCFFCDKKFKRHKQR